MRTTSPLKLGCILALAGALSGYCSAQSNPYGPKFVNKTIVDSAEIDIGQKRKTRTLLTVDRDNSVELYMVRIAGDAPVAAPEFERHLGSRVYYSGQAPLGSVLPANAFPQRHFRLPSIPDKDSISY